MCFSSPKAPAPPPPPSAPLPPAPLAPELPSEAAGVDNSRKVATARRGLRIDLNSGASGSGLNIPM